MLHPQALLRQHPNVDRSNMVAQYEEASGSSQAPSADETFKQHGREDQQQTHDCSVTPTVGSLQDCNLPDLPEEDLVEIFSHLPPSCFPRINAVCRRFDSIMSSSRLWRLVFSRHFPGPAGLSLSSLDKNSEEYQKVLSSPRCFARLNPTTSWLEEYTLRTRLLHSLVRGGSSPELALIKHKLENKNFASLAYPANNVPDFITHIDGSFPPDAPPSFIHGSSANGLATISDPVAKEAQARDIRINCSNGPDNIQSKRDHIQKQHCWRPKQSSPPFDASDAPPHGTTAAAAAAAAEFIGEPTLMDVSDNYGYVFANRSPNGRAKLVSKDARACIWLPINGAAPADRTRGIPNLPKCCRPLVTAAWIAKSDAVPKVSQSSCGVFYGFANGFVAAYAVTSRFCSDAYFEPGDNTANWVLSPGVPIIGIQADDCYTPARKARRRVWAVALNALGEVFYLKDVPVVKAGPRIQDMTLQDIRAWETGRTVRWELVEATRRRSKGTQPPYRFLADPDFCPRSYSDSVQNMDKDMIIAETQCINSYMRIPPANFGRTFHALSMHKTLLVDFGGNDEAGAGESVVVIGGYNTRPSVKRYTRFRAPCGQATEFEPYRVAPATSTRKFDSTPYVPLSGDNWQASRLVALGEQGETTATASAIDTSPLASRAIFEDLLLNARTDRSHEHESVPGQRARFIAVGNAFGTINIWDVRSQVLSLVGRAATLQPIRVIQTSSPRITCLALNSLYLVHGGSDGLVQAWDPLGSGDGTKSKSHPIRTINSPSSPRRYQIMARTSFKIKENDQDIMAGALCLDPDPTKLRGLVALGPWLRYWSFSNGVDELPAPQRSEPQSDVESEKRRGIPRPTWDIAKFIKEEWEYMQLEGETCI